MSNLSCLFFYKTAHFWTSIFIRYSLFTLASSNTCKICKWFVHSILPTLLHQRKMAGIYRNDNALREEVILAKWYIFIAQI